MNKKLGLYLLISCALHGAIILVLYLIAGNSVIPTNFLVLGAHSKEHLETLYKPMGHIIPFVPNHMRAQPKPPTSTPQPPSKTDTVAQIKPPQKAAQKTKASTKQTTIEKEKKKPLIPQNKQPEVKKAEEKKPKQELPKKTDEKITKPITTKKQHETPKKAEQTLAHNQKLTPNPLLLEYQPPVEQTHVFTEHIQKEIARLWRPPVGVPKGTECTIRFTVSKKGKVDRFDFLKRSDIIIYDLSVTRIAHKFEFDHSLWGKTFTIDFRQ